jgi:hypothetical protein
VDKTPAGALRALEGIRETERPTPAEIVASFESPHKEARMERSSSYQSIREPRDKDLAALVAAVKALPASLGAQVERALAREEEEARREEARQALLDVLDAAESRAEAREIRLQGLLAEVSPLIVST